jgi:hypothetical protein
MEEVVLPSCTLVLACMISCRQLYCTISTGSGVATKLVAGTACVPISVASAKSIVPRSNKRWNAWIQRHARQYLVS